MSEYLEKAKEWEAEMEKQSAMTPGRLDAITASAASISAVAAIAQAEVAERQADAMESLEALHLRSAEALASIADSLEKLVGQKGVVYTKNASAE